MHVFLFGAGYSARAFAHELGSLHVPVAGTTRAVEKFGALRAAGIAPLLFEGSALNDDVKRELLEVTHLVVSAAPDESGDPLLNALGGRLRSSMPRLAWIGYLSTVGVYGDHRGEWVDETAALRPKSARSVARVAAEQAWQDAASEGVIPLAILRLSGIYGPGRNAFVNLHNGTARRLVKPGQVFNRIHVGDIAGALLHLSERALGGIFNVTDNLPTPPQDVVALAAKIAGVEPPPEIPFAAAKLSPMQLSFYGENKRVSNVRLKQSGYLFRFPDYRAGLDALWRDGWSGAGETDARTPIRR